MAESPRLSVIMPAYNAEETIEAALDSLIAQSFKNWEAIIVDDGSNDATASIVARRVRLDCRLRSVSGAREGASAARNRGIAQARGEWMSFLDADDWVSPIFMERLLGALDAAPGHQVAYGGYCRVMPDGSMTASVVDPRVQAAPFPTFARSCAVTINSLVIQRQIVLNAGGFDTGLSTCEDWDLWQRVSRAGAQWLMVDEQLAYYRASAGSLTRASRQMLEDGRTVIHRAFEPDARVSSPLTGFATGLDAGGYSPQEAYSWFALWNLAVALSAGDDLAISRDILAALPRESDMARAVADSLVDALCVSLRTVPASLAARWPDYAQAMDHLFTELGAAWDDPVAERRMRYALDHRLLCHDDVSAPRQLGLTLGLRMAAEEPVMTTQQGPQDRLYTYVMHGQNIAAIAEPAMLGRYDLLEWIDQTQFPDPSRKAIGGFIRALASPRPIDKACDYHGIESPWASFIERIARKLSRNQKNARDRYLNEGLQLINRMPGMYPTGGHNRELATLAVQARAEALCAPRPTVPAPPRLAAPSEAARNSDRKSFWESYFAVEDPWNYGSPYEQEKYRLQLSLLPEGRIGRALELACAEGRFSAMLAERVSHLTATDIAQPAVERARTRCREHRNIDFAVLDLSRDPLPKEMDLIVCSEVLYYLDDVAELERVAGSMAGALAPGGTIITAHAYVISDDRRRTGFDWANPFGVQVIAETLQKTPGLVLDHSIQTDLYRVDRFRSAEPGKAVPFPTVHLYKRQTPLEPAVARRVLWNGASALRGEVAEERRQTIPVLMYHSISDEGPDRLKRYRLSPDEFREQMCWLRSNGYHAVTADHVQWHLANQEPFAGRPVWITFDDGFQDFADNAWPILQGLDLTAEMFLVTDHVGSTSAWDTRYGDTSQLMAPPTIARLAQEGAFFGSHLASHRAADGLSSRDLAAELLRSRALIERWIGWPPSAVAAPFGATDGRFARLAEQCGYVLALGGGEGAVSLGDGTFDLNRMEVRGDRSLADFIERLEKLR